VRDDFVYAEGPAWFAARDYFVFSDTRTGKKLYTLKLPDTVSEFRTVGYANGNAIGPEGDLYTGQDNKIIRTNGAAIDGEQTLVADVGAMVIDGVMGALINDIVVSSKGVVYATALRAGEQKGKLGSSSA
jgi:sugar lactone lactonase YvrE